VRPIQNVWDEWGRITRFFESSRIALAREATLWTSLELANPDEALVRISDGSRIYQVSLPEHAEAVSDTWFLYASALLSYFALTEAAAAELLGLDDLVGLDGVGEWGARILSAAGNEWDAVHGGKAGIIQVAVVRNQVAHGDRTYSLRSVSRLKAAGVLDPVAYDDPVVLNDKVFRDYRLRLKSLLNHGGLGTET